MEIFGVFCFVELVEGVGDDGEDGKDSFEGCVFGGVVEFCIDVGEVEECEVFEEVEGYVYFEEDVDEYFNVVYVNFFWRYFVIMSVFM